LLLHLRRLTAGDRMPCVLACPSPDCGARLDLDLKVSDLLVPPYHEAREGYEARMGDGAGACHVRFRLPNGSDQEAAADLARTDQEVHLLAYHYHWSPSEILGLSVRRRARYLRVLEDELTRGGAE